MDVLVTIGNKATVGDTHLGVWPPDGQPNCLGIIDDVLFGNWRRLRKLSISQETCINILNRASNWNNHHQWDLQSTLPHRGVLWRCRYPAPPDQSTPTKPLLVVLPCKSPSWLAKATRKSRIFSSLMYPLYLSVSWPIWLRETPWFRPKGALANSR